MIQDLVILGLLKEGPKHGYEIKKLIEEVLSTFSTLDSQSIYYPLRRLEKKGLVTKKPGRLGKRPEKFVYHITKEGEKTFTALLDENFLTFQRPIFNIDLSLYFLPLVKSGLAKDRLRKRLVGMNKILHWLKQRKATLQKEKKPYHLLAIIDHQIGLTEADIKFTQDLTPKLELVK